MRRVSAIGNTRRQKKCNHSVDTLETQRVPALRISLLIVNTRSHSYSSPLAAPRRGHRLGFPRHGPWISEALHRLHYFALHCTDFEEYSTFPLYSWSSPPLERGQGGCIPAAAIAIPSRNRKRRIVDREIRQFGPLFNSPGPVCMRMASHFLPIYICAGFRIWPFLDRSFDLCERTQVQSI